MPRFSRSSRRPASRAARLTKEWYGTWTFASDPESPTPITLASSSYFRDWIISPTDALNFFDEPTILRTVGSLWLAGDAIAATVATQVELGFIVTRDEGLAGTPPIRDPLLEADYDWMFTWYSGVIAPVAAGAGAWSEGFNFNSLTRRKMPGGFGLAVNVVNRGTGAVRFMMQMRTLFAH